jgi:hypothetical protein
MTANELLEGGMFNPICEECSKGKLCATSKIHVPATGDTMFVPRCVQIDVMESLFCDGAHKVILTEMDGDLLLNHLSVEFVKPGPRIVRDLPHPGFTTILIVPPGTSPYED